MLSFDDDEIVEWFESLESRLVDLIFSKSELWFQNEMEMSDIENNFNSITRAFKGGKYHLVRVNIPKNKKKVIWTLLAARFVVATFTVKRPLIAQGCRPTSATIQPDC